MSYSYTMQIVHSLEDLKEISTCFKLLQPTAIADHIIELSAFDELCDYVQTFFCF